MLLNGEEIEQVYEAKLLGVILDPQLTFRGHITQLQSNLRYIIPSLAKMHNAGIQSTIIICVYKALFVSYLNYCIIIYGETHAYLIDKLQVAQNDAIRAMFGYKTSTSVKETMLSHKLLNVRNIYK